MAGEFEPSPAFLDHASAPRNLGPPSAAEGYARFTGQCGDTMEVWLRCRDGRVLEARFATDGCAPSRAAGSAVTELARGLPLEEVLEIGGGEVISALGGMPEDSRHCAVLAAETLHGACRDVLRGGSDAAAERERRQAAAEQARSRLQARLAAIRHAVIVLSGKGGVGKSTVAVGVARAAARAGLAVGLLDADLHGPAVPILLGLTGSPLMEEGGELLPVDADGLKVMSIGFLLAGRDEPVVWGSQAKVRVIEQFLRDVRWGSLDLLVVDAPPGTGEELLAICRLLGRPDGALVVTTPQEAVVAAVRRAIAFCWTAGLPVLGVIENMADVACPWCGRPVKGFGSGAGEAMAGELGVPFLGRVPADPAVAAAFRAEGGTAGQAVTALESVAASVVTLVSEKNRAADAG
jgi:Mrp family chromosome partitioning ATPase